MALLQHICIPVDASGMFFKFAEELSRLLRVLGYLSGQRAPLTISCRVNANKILVDLGQHADS
jgi:hypothetical protein